MYITISPQDLSKSDNQSSQKFVSYLEKENEIKGTEKEFFFDQDHDKVDADTVVKDIDGNTGKLKKTEVKFYSIVISPSKEELKKLQNSNDIKDYVRSAMKDYAAAFYRKEPITVNDIKYFAKIEHTRKYKGKDIEVRNNAPYIKELKELQKTLSKLQPNDIAAKTKILESIEQIKTDVPYKNVSGKPIRQGMFKDGDQRHIHVIVSRINKNNNLSLSPGAAYKESKTKFNGKEVFRGFNRDAFFANAEKKFDDKFSYNRNYSDSYKGRKDKKNSPEDYYKNLQKEPPSNRQMGIDAIRGKSPKDLENMANRSISEIEQQSTKTTNFAKRGWNSLIVVDGKSISRREALQQRLHKSPLESIERLEGKAQYDALLKLYNKLNTDYDISNKGEKRIQDTFLGKLDGYALRKIDPITRNVPGLREQVIKDMKEDIKVLMKERTRRISENLSKNMTGYAFDSSKPNGDSKYWELNQIMVEIGKLDEKIETTKSSTKNDDIKQREKLWREFNSELNKINKFNEVPEDKGIEAGVDKKEEKSTDSNKRDSTVNDKQGLNIGKNGLDRIGSNLLHHAKRTVLPEEVKEALGKLENIKSGRIPETNISIAQLNNYVKDAQKIIKLATVGSAVPEPTLQAAKIVFKYSLQIGKALIRSTGASY